MSTFPPSRRPGTAPAASAGSSGAPSPAARLAVTGCPCWAAGRHLPPLPPAPTRVPDGFGSVRTSPRLPAGFIKTSRSRLVQANGIRQHVVIGGDGPPLLLVHGGPEN